VAAFLPMTASNDSCRSLASPSVFEEVLDGGGALSGREERAEEPRYDKSARKIDFEGHLRALVLLHTTAYESARDLTWAAEEDLLFKALGADFNISVRGLRGALGRPPDRAVLADVHPSADGRRRASPPAPARNFDGRVRIDCRSFWHG